MLTIELTQGKTTVVDKADFDWLSSRKWRAHSCGANNCRTIAVSGYIKGKYNTRVLMHRLIWERHNGKIPSGLVMDHRNGDPLDNRLSNLRVCTMSQNRQNSRLCRNSKSGYKGVYKQDDRWRAIIKVAGRNVHLGYFDKVLDAAKAYNDAALHHFGEFARINKL